MIEREAQTSHDRPLIAAVIYNRLREGIPLGIDATIYYAVELQKGIATYTDELTRIAAEDRLAVQHAHPQRPAADADRQSRPGLDRSGGASLARQLPVLRRRRRRLRRAGLLEHLRRNSRRTSPPIRPRSRRTAGIHPPASTSDAAVGRARLARRAQPLAGDPQRGARGAGHGRLALPATSGAAGAVRIRPRSPSAAQGSWERT